MNKKFTYVIRCIALAAMLLAALSFAACGETAGGQNTSLPAAASEVEISGIALTRFEYEFSSSINTNDLHVLDENPNISSDIENIIFTKHTSGEGRFTYDLVIKKDDKVLALPLSGTYTYFTRKEASPEYRYDVLYTCRPYLCALADGRVAVCGYEGVFFIDLDTLTYEKFEFGLLPIEAPFVVRAVRLGYDGKFTLLATDEEFDYIIKLDENKNVDEYEKISSANVYWYTDKQNRVLFGQLTVASDSNEFIFSADRSGSNSFYYDGETDEYFKVTRRNANEQGEYYSTDKMIIYRTPEEYGFKDYTAVATYDNGETLRMVKFDGYKLDDIFYPRVSNAQYTYERDVATYYLAPDFFELRVDFAANTANVKYSFTKDMLGPSPFATSADGRYALYVANYSEKEPWDPSQVVLYDTTKKEITYIAGRLKSSSTKGHVGFFKNGDIYVHNMCYLHVFSPKTAQQGPALTLNVQADFGLHSLIYTFRRDPGDKSIVVVCTAAPSSALIPYAIAFYSADGKLISSVASDVPIFYTNNGSVELSITVNGNTYIVKGYDGDNKPVVHFEYTVGDAAIVNKL